MTATLCMAVLSRAPTSQPSGLNTALQRYHRHSITADPSDPAACVRQLIRSCITDSVHGERFIHAIFSTPMVRNVTVLWWSYAWNIREDHRIGCDALVKLSKLYFRVRMHLSDRLNAKGEGHGDGGETIALERVASYFLILRDRLCNGLRTFGSHTPDGSIPECIQPAEWWLTCTHLLQDPFFRLF